MKLKEHIEQFEESLLDEKVNKPTFKDIEDGLSNHLRGKLLDIMKKIVEIDRFPNF